jgi:signal peptidase I
MKRRSDLARTLLLGLALGAGLVAWWVTLAPEFLGGPAGYVIVQGVSMEPTLYTGDLVVTRREAEYRPGEVVAYRVAEGIVIHRIVGGSPETGFLTRGDNKPDPDPWRPRPDDIIGRLWLHIPGAGRWLERLREPPAFAALASGLAALPVVWSEPERARRRGGRRVPAKAGGGGPGPAWALGLLVLAGLGALAFGVVAFFAFR